MPSNISISADIGLDLPLAFSPNPSGIDVHVVEAAGGMTGTSKEIEAVPDDGPQQVASRCQQLPGSKARKVRWCTC